MTVGGGEVSDEQVLGAIAALSMLSPVEENVVKYIFLDNSTSWCDHSKA
ncbi:hypothetical protein NWP21_03155 [Anabaenopsis sp. FSS-46]|nr:hypothetical protein [Anabaenopsis sp. FSS-46]MDH6097857.1 hypothetical protein [Anabaenopsis sp. FSS-46]